MNSQQKRNTYFDFLRGIAIIMVVAIHTYSQGNNIVVRQIFNAAVPLFIAISGYFLIQKKFSNKKQYFTFLKKQIFKVYIPTFIWSLPFFCFALYSGGSILKNIMCLFFCGFSKYYFIAFIIQCYIVLPFIKRFINNNKCIGLLISFFISIIWIGSYLVLSSLYSVTLPTILYAGPLPCLVLFFVIGGTLGMKLSRDYNLLCPIVIIVLGFIASILSSTILGVTVGQKPTSFIFSMGLIFILFHVKSEMFFSIRSKLYDFIVWIGKVSFSVYLMHMYLVEVVDKFELENWFIKASFALILTLICVVILKKVLPQKIHKIVGL